MSKKQKHVGTICVETSINTDDFAYQVGLLEDDVTLEMICLIDAAKADWEFSEQATVKLLDNFFCTDLEDLKEINPKTLYNKCKEFVARFEEARK